MQNRQKVQFMKPGQIMAVIIKYRARVAFVPIVLIGQFPGNYSAWKIYPGIMEQGTTHVYGTKHGISILIEKINRYMAGHSVVKWVISSLCPAIVRLIN